MGDKPANWWIILAAGVLAGVFLLKDFVDHAHAILGHAGYRGLLTSPTIHHKVGEILVGAPLYMTALMRPVWPAERIIANLKSARPLLALGSALNVLAWVGSAAPASDFNKIWFLLLAVAGIAAPPILIRLLGSKTETPS